LNRQDTVTFAFKLQGGTMKVSWNMWHYRMK